MLRQAVVAVMLPRGLLGKQFKDPSEYVVKMDEDGSLELVVEADASSSAGEAQVDAADDTFLNAKLDFTEPKTFEARSTPPLPFPSAFSANTPAKILKEFQLLTSHTLRDPVLTSLSQHPSPLKSLVEKTLELQEPAPEKVHEKLMMNQSLTQQGNLLIFPRRETPVDKEKEVGRWKVIEKELAERGLPVLGRLKSDSNLS
jgi:hypothetical protein